MSIFQILCVFVVSFALLVQGKLPGVPLKKASGTIAVFGATGCLGRECVHQALKNNNKVVVLARDPSKLVIPEGSGAGLANRPFDDARLKVIKGDVKNQADVDALFDSTDDISSVMVALGGRTKNVGPTMLTDGTSHIVSAMKRKSKAKRICLVTSIGCGSSAGKAPLKFKMLMYTVMSSIYKDKNNQEGIFLAPSGAGHDLEYCIVRPGQLGNGPATGVINVQEAEGGAIQRADVASFMLSAVTDPKFPHLQKAVCLSSEGGTAWVKEKKEGFDGVSKA